jgi:hypothetical protein
MDPAFTRARLRSATLVLLIAVAPSLVLAGEAGGVTFSAEVYRDHVKRLASDEWGGRGPGQEGIEKAAEYIADHFRAHGLKPAGDNGTYFQSFDIRRGKNLVRERADFKVEGLEAAWKVDADWRPLPFSQVGDIEGPLAFAGYGISAERYNFDDYAGFDATGKVLLMMRYEPKDADPNAVFGGSTPSSHSMFSRKARIAADKGAKAIIIVNPPNRDPDKDELYEFSSRFTRQSYELPMIQVKREVAEALLKRAGMPDLATLTQELDEGRQSLSTDLKGVKVRIATGLEANVIKARNVIGLMPGAGQTDELIVIGAHYDHLGTREEDDKKTIFNGADDNASGTSGVLELVTAFSRQPPPRRGILFMTFSAEEMGLLGSKHFVDNPTVDYSRIKFMMNLDMIGRYRPETFEIYGADTGEGFEALAEELAGELSLQYRLGSSMFGNSDHASFYDKGTPVMFPFTGLHEEYHKPEDDWELINAEGATQVLQFAYRLSHRMAMAEQGPVYRERGRARRNSPAAAAAEQAAREQAAENQPARPETPPAEPPAPPRRARVRLGIMPSYAESDEPGMLVESVVPNQPAAQAGMKDGDRIIQIGDKDIGDVQEYMAAMSAFSPGDEVQIIVRRQGEKVTLKVKLAGQDGPK